MMNYPLTKDFVARTKALLADETASLLEALEADPPVAIRCNPYKLASPAEGEPVKWNRYGRYLNSRPSFTNDPLFHAGTYYVQEASSMFVEHLVREAEEAGPLRILDLCAAPGGKATLYSTIAGADGIVVANETIRSRALILADNIRKWGIGNVIVTNNDPSHVGALREWFDVVAVDAPCSGEGMFRKNPQARAEWSVANVGLCAARQRRILSEAWEALRPGGVLIYSTCTFNREENEENVKWTAGNFTCTDAGVEVPDEWNIEETFAAGIKCFRFWPHRLAGEGFFAAAIRKGGQKGRPYRPKARKPILSEASRNESTELSRWVGQPELMRYARIGEDFYGYYAASYPETKAVAEYLNAIHSGICMGQFFAGKLKPDHSLALFHDICRGAVPEASLSTDDALRYLRRDELPAELFPAEGINLVTFEGHTLGWVKKVSPRINNLYPKSQMILRK